jgi:hypothetical protein
VSILSDDLLTRNLAEFDSIRGGANDDNLRCMRGEEGYDFVEERVKSLTRDD